MENEQEEKTTSSGRRERRTETKPKKERAKNGQEAMVKEQGKKEHGQPRGKERKREAERSSTCDSATYTRSILWVYVVSVSQF